MTGKSGGKKMSSGLKRKLIWAGAAAGVIQSEISQGFSRMTNSAQTETSIESRMLQAAKLVTKLSHLKGAAMKLGQLLALEAREFFPDEVVEILEKLQSSATYLDEDIIQQILEKELGERAKQFENFSPRPIAAASIGQVHSANVDGRLVAVKVQYPEIEKSLETDIALLKQLLGLISIFSGKRKINTDGLVDEIGMMFTQEINYHSELVFLQEYREHALKVPGLYVPAAYPQFSSARVLTLEFVKGVTLSQSVRDNHLTSIQKEYYADLFMKLFTLEFCEWGLVQTDPNLGNFLLETSADRLNLLDFGGARRYSEKFRQSYCRLILSAYRFEEKNILNLAHEMNLIDPRESKLTEKVFVDLIVQSMIPFRKPIYDFSDGEYLSRMRIMTQSLIKELKFSPPPRDLIFLHRKLGGIFQILRRLESKTKLTPYLEVYERTANLK